MYGRWGEIPISPKEESELGVSKHADRTGTAGKRKQRFFLQDNCSGGEGIEAAINRYEKRYR